MDTHSESASADFVASGETDNAGSNVSALKPLVVEGGYELPCDGAFLDRVIAEKLDPCGWSIGKALKKVQNFWKKDTRATCPGGHRFPHFDWRLCPAHRSFVSRVFTWLLGGSAIGFILSLFGAIPGGAICYWITVGLGGAWLAQALSVMAVDAIKLRNLLGEIRRKPGAARDLFVEFFRKQHEAQKKLLIGSDSKIAVRKATNQETRIEAKVVLAHFENRYSKDASPDLMHSISAIRERLARLDEEDIELSRLEESAREILTRIGTAIESCQDKMNDVEMNLRGARICDTLDTAIAATTETTREVIRTLESGLREAVTIQAEIDKHALLTSARSARIAQLDALGSGIAEADRLIAVTEDAENILGLEPASALEGGSRA